MILLVVIALSFRAGAGLQSVEYMSSRSNPLQAAITMLEAMRSQNSAEGEKEDADYKKFTEWCRKGSRQLKFDIKDAQGQIEDLEAILMKAESDIASFSSKVDDAAAAQSDSEGQLKAAKAIRDKEHAAFVATEKELVSSIETLERASNVLQRKMKGAALVQTTVNSPEIKSLLDSISEVVNAAGLSLHEQSSIMSLAQSSEGEEDDAEALAGEKKSSSILDLLEDLKQKAEKQLRQLRKEETNMRYNFESVEMSLKDEIRLAAKDMSEAKDGKSVATGTKATTEGDLDGQKKGLAADSGSLKKMEESCVSKAAAYDSSLAERTQEDQALKEALKALKESTFLQLESAKADSFIQIKDSPDGFRVVNVLRAHAHETNNAALAQLAARVSTVMTKASKNNGNPFKKVTNMISSMVAKLEKEAAAEANGKAVCDKQKADSKEKKADLSYKIKKRTALVDKATAKTAALKEEVTQLQKELSDMAAQQAEADELRRNEKNTFLEVKESCEKGIKGVKKALKLLRKQYGSSPEGVMSGILSMLELVEEDTSKKLATAIAEENAAAAEYKKMTADNNIAKFTKEKTAGYREKEIKQWAKTMTEYSSDLDGLTTQMDSVSEAEKLISKQCDAQPQSYADKKARREAEMEGLKDGLAALEAQTASFLQRSSVRSHSALRGKAELK